MTSSDQDPEFATDRHLRPTPTDGYPTHTSDIQASTEHLLKSYIPSVPANPGQEPLLQRNLHLQYLLRNLIQGLPSYYVAQDASQPWLNYWSLQGFSVLGVGLDDQTKKRARQTLLALQHPDGGFSGGPGQAPHLLATYASVCAFAIVGQPGEGGGWDEIDRKKMYDFFMSLKEPDGSFRVMHHGEVDVRGVYCLLVAATLLNIVTPELLRGVPEFVASCQTYEGGFGNTSFSEWAFLDGDGMFDASAPRPVLGEAHGGYTFCATATWVFLQPYLRLYYASPPAAGPSTAPPAPTINLGALTRWLVQMQGSEIELGGFRGRTNKLVDGCYSWWVGGCLALAAGLRNPLPSPEDAQGPPAPAGEPEVPELVKDDSGSSWDDMDDAIYSRTALQEYIIHAGQHPAGGLRDKPPKSADAYHTLSCLAGLSSAQHNISPDGDRRSVLLHSWNREDAQRREVTPPAQTDEERTTLDTLRREWFAGVLCWLEEEGTSTYVGGPNNRLNATHPLFDLTVSHSEAMMKYFYGQNPPARQPRFAARK